MCDHAGCGYAPLGAVGRTLGTVNLRSCGRSANRISLIRHTRPGESRRRTGENRPGIAQVDSTPGHLSRCPFCERRRFCAARSSASMSFRLAALGGSTWTPPTRAPATSNYRRREQKETVESEHQLPCPRRNPPVGTVILWSTWRMSLICRWLRPLVSARDEVSAFTIAVAAQHLPPDASALWSTFGRGSALATRCPSSLPLCFRHRQQFVDRESSSG